MRTPVGIVIGSDTEYGGPGDIRIKCGPKWVAFGGWHVGISGQPRLATMLRDPANAMWKKAPAVYDVISKIRKLCRDDGWKIDEATGEAPYLQVHLLLTDGNEIYMVSGRFHADKVDADFAAVGSGCQIAYGIHYGMKRRNACPLSASTVSEIIEGCVAICDTCLGDPYVARVGPKRRRK